MSAFTVYAGSGDTTLTDALLAPGSGITVSNIVLNASGPGAVSFYDGSLSPLGIGAGLLLTSGTVPGMTNTVGWFGQDNSATTGFFNGDSSIDAVVNTVFQTQSFDATTLSFDIVAADPAATSVSFDLVFGSDEFPEWVDQFVDCATVMVNGVNYALFNHDPTHPLSVVSANLAAGYFQDNTGNVLPIEYDGVSHVLKIVAPINPGATNHIAIGIADTGDHIYDSGIFLANLKAGNIPGSGVVIAPPSTGTSGSDNLTGTSKDEYFTLLGGDDTCYAGAGDDIVVAGDGSDIVFGGSGADQMKGDAGDDSLDGGDGVDTAVYSGASSGYLIASAGTGFTITDKDSGPNSEGTDVLTNVELVKFSDGLFALGADGNLIPVTDPATPPSNTPGSVVISGIGSEGKVLTATVSDPDGVSAAVTYQWQVSDDNGASWTDVGDGSSNYTVSGSDLGKEIQVVASYVDNGSQAEAPVSAPKAILASGGGDLVVTLMHLDAPLGASVINPLTTLVQDAIELGVSPNVAAQGIKAVLGLPGGINLLTYDAYTALQANPHDPVALAVEEAAVQVAILTSLSDDDTGVNLTSSILNAADANQSLDLASAGDLASILGIDITGLTVKDYPQPLREIFDRNKSMSDAIADGGGAAAIEAEWQDFLSVQDGVASTSIADLSIHVNQAPTGSATASLAAGLENIAYTISASDLLQGFSDPEGGSLSVSGLGADNGYIVDNNDGTFTITFAAGFTGPVELVYTVVDGQGAGAPASQMIVIAPGALVNQAPTVTSGGLAVVNENLAASTVVYAATATDPDAGDMLSWSLTGPDASLLSIAPNGQVTLNAPADFEVKSSYSFNVVATDNGGLGAVRAVVLTVQDVNEAPTVTSGGLAAVNENLSASTVVYTATATDPDAGDTLSWSLTGPDASLLSIAPNGQVTLNAPADFEAKSSYSFNVVATDNGGLGAVRAVVLTVQDVNEAPTVTSGGLAVVNENLPPSTVVYTATATDPDAGDTLSWSLTGPDASLLSIAPNGQVTLNASADFEVKSSYSFNVVATDSGGLSDAQAVVLAINDVAGVNIVGTSGANIINAFTSVAGQPVPTNEGDTISGGGGKDTIDALGGNDFIDGGAGADTMRGGSGNDTYVVDSKGDIVVELANDGIDTILSSISYVLPTNVENLSLNGGDNLSGTGNAAANVIVGNAGNNVLAGLGGADHLDGGLGTDTASYVASATGVVVSLATGSGSGGDAEGDTLVNIENLTGSNFDDTLEGNSGDNVLVGGSGVDTVSYEHAMLAVTVNLAVTAAQDTVGAGSDSLSGFANVTGSAFNDKLTGSSGANVINGLDGDDVLAGGGGADTLTGGAGHDRFVLLAKADSSPGNSDIITDFVHGTDLIDLTAIDANQKVKGDQAFSFGGENANVVAYGVTWFERDGDTLIQADYNGNSTADIAITLIGIGHHLAASDFLL